jgi:hypothetical protein
MKKKYPPEFKAKVALEALHSLHPILGKEQKTGRNSTLKISEICLDKGEYLSWNHVFSRNISDKLIKTS